MKITIVCSSERHPVNKYLAEWIERHSQFHQIDLIRDKNDARGGDILFLISCGQKVERSDREKYGKTLVVHASDLPEGKGWNPHVWQILDGKTEFVVSLLEAADKIDSGDIWEKVKCEIPKDALWDEINHYIFSAELKLMDFAVENYKIINPQPQQSVVDHAPYRLRNPEDSRIDPSKSIAEQFDLIRVCDPDRFPAFFELYGVKYRLTLEKI
ncbi:UDP-glucuronic acid dehydrogenase [Crenobacter luteus]|uniref:UDP-glucuronic acid dehydrogenase n=1 Tax=Crenobacter luteus TaxID=1452487 RepID=UPI0009ED074F|nr:UDP-glucuronic acid dehydrogenase [Crenobacter luteus]